MGEQMGKGEEEKEKGSKCVSKLMKGKNELNK